MNIYERIDEIEGYIDKLDKNSVVKLICRDDFDSIIASLILFSLLKKLGFKVHMRITNRLENIFKNSIYINFSGNVEGNLIRTDYVPLSYIAYVLTKKYYNEHCLGIFPLIVSIFEFQDHNGSLPEIYDELIEECNINVKKDFRLLLCNSLKLSCSLKSFFPPYLIGISGDDEGVSNFLKELDISDKRLEEISSNEFEMVKNGILKKYENLSEYIIGNIYLYDGLDLRIIAYDLYSLYKTDFGKFLKVFFNKELEPKGCGEYFLSMLQNCLKWVRNNMNKIIKTESFHYIYTFENLDEDFIKIVLRILRYGKIFEETPFAIFLRKNKSFLIYIILDKYISDERLREELSDILIELDIFYPYIKLRIKEGTILRFLQILNRLLIL